jgi:hypothetical protein
MEVISPFSDATGKKLHRIRGLKGMCQNKMKRNHVYDFSSFYSDTLPLILIFYAAFTEEYTSVSLL